MGWTTLGTSSHGGCQQSFYCLPSREKWKRVSLSDRGRCFKPVKCLCSFFYSPEQNSCWRADAGLQHTAQAKLFSSLTVSSLCLGLFLTFLILPPWVWQLKLSPCNLHPQIIKFRLSRGSFNSTKHNTSEIHCLHVRNFDGSENWCTTIKSMLVCEVDDVNIRERHLWILEI